MKTFLNYFFIFFLSATSLFYEAGTGAEFYLQYFKFALEAKLSLETVNMLVKDEAIFSSTRKIKNFYDRYGTTVNEK